jgi:preprotein translocase subunit YajC
MNGFALSGWAAMAPVLGEAGQSNVPPLLNLFPFLVLIVVVFFVMIRPQQKKAKEHAEMLKQLKTGDKVVTNGGVIGVVVGVKEKSVSVRSAESKLEVLKSAVTEITERAGSSSEAKES